MRLKWCKMLIPRELAKIKTARAALAVFINLFRTMKLIGRKLKMTQVFKDSELVGVTPIRFTANAPLADLKAGDRVKVSGVTKGKGFAGVVKPHGFHGGPKTHGQKNRLRHPGSIGNTSPQRIIPGRKMAGHMGTTRQTTLNLLIVDLDSEKKILMIKGAVPGYNKRSVLEIVKIA